MNVLSLFSGIGGLELGLERAGMTTVGQVERDPYCLRVLAKHWPEVPRHDDVTTAVDWWRSEPRPTVHVVCGGFPCQPVSLAGRGLAQADDRWLWPAMWAVIRDLRPRFAILENVPGLLGRGMGDVFADLAEGGYDSVWGCVSASSVGAPHRRDRVFVVAHPHGDARWLQPITEPRSSGRTVPGDDGAPRLMADADLERPERARPTARQGAGAEPPRRSPHVADTDRSRQLQPRRIFSQERRRLSDSGWWSAEPDVGRVAHGIPNRVDRLRALGNAVVPQVAEHIGRLVMAAA